MTRDGTPVVGPTRYRNLYKHRPWHVGLTVVCGSGRVLFDLISGWAPAGSDNDLAADGYKDEW